MVSVTQKARKARIKVLDMIYKAQSSHIGSNFSCIDLLTVLFERINLDIDMVIFSKGWIAASAYYFLADKGAIPQEDLEKYCDGESKYIGLVEPGTPGIHFAGGSMGYGLPAGVGFALSKKLLNESGKVYVLMSDGEQAIGTTQEAALIAAHHKLDNLIVIIDDNKLQAMGKTEEILKIPSLYNLWKAFGWNALLVDGHNHSRINAALTTGAYKGDQKPFALIADTIKGKGVSFMENNNLYHYKNLSEDEYQRALDEL